MSGHRERRFAAAQDRAAGALVAREGAVPIHLVVALGAEAAPLVDAWMLRRRSGGAFVCFDGQLPGSRHPVRLVVSGVGRARCAAAVGWLVGGDPEASARAVWLNVGVGGADRHDGLRATDDGATAARIGDVVLASVVRDATRARLLERVPDGASDRPDRPGEHGGPRLCRTGRVPCWYPPWLGRRPPEELAGVREPRLVRSIVHTVDLPETSFDEPGVYEMEAAAFLESTLPFSTAERVQVVKVVSDTPRSGLAVVDRDAVAGLCAAAVPMVVRLAQEIAHWTASGAEEEPESARWREGWAERLRLTVAQRRQLNRLVERTVALHGGRPEVAAGALEAVLAELAAAGPRPDRVDRRRVLSGLTRWVDELALGSSADPGFDGAEDPGADPEPRSPES